MTINQQTLDDDASLDRLVDGEMVGEEYQNLLKRLDDQPDGWRRCALAFLEAQAWGQDFRGLPTESTHHAPVARGDRPSRWFDMATMIVAVATIFVVAFGLGMYFRGAGSSTNQNPSHELIVTRGVESPALDPKGTSDSPRPAPLAPATTIAPQREPLGNVRFVVNRNDGAADHEVVDVPFFNLSDMDPQWLSSELSPIPADLLNELDRLGHEVWRDKRLVPVELRDGRRVVIPVEQFEIMPVSQRMYQ